MRPKVLLVDDEPYILDYLEQELEDLDLEILRAANGQEALDACAQHLPDMVFLDLMMPVMDGLTVLNRLKADPESSGVPVVIVSAADDMRSIVRGIQAGAEDYLPKPINPVLLHARLNAGLEKKRLRDIERRYLHSLERDLAVGREMQSGFLPRHLPEPPGWQIAAFYRPAREVAGDFYDVFELEDGRLALLVGDVADKGVGSALYMALFRTLLRASVMMNLLSACAPGPDARPESRIQQAVTLANDYLGIVHRSAMFATLFYAILDPTSGRLSYVNAGHDHPLILRETAIHAEVAPTGPAVGILAGAEFGSASLDLQPGDSLVLYSDGVVDALDPAGERFGAERWRSLVRRPAASAYDLLASLTHGVLAFAGDAPQYDDMTLVVLRRL